MKVKRFVANLLATGFVVKFVILLVSELRSVIFDSRDLIHWLALTGLCFILVILICLVVWLWSGEKDKGGEMK